MKIFIWLIFCIIFSFIQTILKDCGVTLGALPTILIYAAVFAPASWLCNTWDVRRYKKKYNDNLINDLSNIVSSLKSDFLKEKNFDAQDEGVELFEEMREDFLTFNDKKIQKTMIEIIKSDNSPFDYVLNFLEKESIVQIKKGDTNEIKIKHGKTYTYSKIYEFAIDLKFKNNKLTPIQHKNLLAYIDYICNENAEKK